MCQLGPPWGHPWGWAEVGGPCWAPGGVKPKEKSGCAQLWLGHPWLQGGIFVLYFSYVPRAWLIHVPPGNGD